MRIGLVNLLVIRIPLALLGSSEADVLLNLFRNSVSVKRFCRGPDHDAFPSGSADVRAIMPLQD